MTAADDTILADLDPDVAAHVAERAAAWPELTPEQVGLLRVLLATEAAQ